MEHTEVAQGPSTSLGGAEGACGVGLHLQDSRHCRVQQRKTEL